MESTARYKPSARKIVFFSLIALVIGALHPILLMYQTLLLAWLPYVYVIAAALLYAGGGIIPAAIMGVVGIAGAYWSMSPTIATVTLPLTVLPAVVIVLGIRARKPFFIQLRNALIAAVAGALLAIVLAIALIGGDMVSQFMDMLRSLSDGAMPSLYEIYLPVLESRGASVTYEQFLAAYREVLATMQILYETNLAGAVLADSIVTALIAALWGNWISARHGDATAKSFIGLAGWHMPSNMTIGLLLALAAGGILAAIGMRGAEIAWAAISNIASLAFCVQLFAANDRRLKAAGATRGRRTGLGILLYVLILIVPIAKMLAPLIGAASALFGRTGAVTLWKQKHDQSDNSL